jgi:Ca2+-binding EF-hand superfamily protein
MASDEEKKELTKTFKALDINGDGTLSKEEIKNGYKRNNIAITNEELEHLVSTVDSNKNNAINYKEFMVASLNRRELLTDARIDSCFKLFDKVSFNLRIGFNLNRILLVRLPSRSSKICLEETT